MNEITQDSNAALASLIKNGNDLEARDMAERMTASGSTDYYPYWVLGNYLMEDSVTLDWAVSFLQKAHSLAPDDFATLCDLALTLRRLKRNEEAKTVLLRGLLREPDDLHLQHSLAECFAELDQNKDAVSEYESTKRRYPSDAEAWIDAGDIYRKLERWEEALKEYELALSIDPGNSELLKKIAAVKAAIG